MVVDLCGPLFCRSSWSSARYMRHIAAHERQAAQEAYAV